MVQDSRLRVGVRGLRVQRREGERESEMEGRARGRERER